MDLFFVSEQENLGMSKTDLALPPRQTVPKKYPGRRAIYPRRICPRIMIYYAPIATAIMQSMTSPPGVPLLPFCYALPVVLFLAFCIDRTRRAFNRIA